LKVSLINHRFKAKIRLKLKRRNYSTLTAIMTKKKISLMNMMQMHLTSMSKITVQTSWRRCSTKMKSQLN